MRAFLFLAWWTTLVVLLTLKASGAALSWWIVLMPIYAIPLVGFALIALIILVVLFNGLSPKPGSPKL